MKKLISNHKRTQIGMISFLTLMICFLALMTTMPNAHATYNALGKAHTPNASKFHAGDTVDFTIIVNVLQFNGGPALSIENLTIIDPLPAGETFVTGSNTSTPLSSFTAYPNGTLFWNFGFGPFETTPQAVVSYNITVAANAPSGFLYNTAAVVYDETLSGAHSAPTVSDYIFVVQPSITLTKTPSSSKIENNTSVTYTYNVTNTGNVALTVGLTDDKFGTIFTGLSLGPGVSNITTVTKTLIADTTNTATATGVDQTGASVSATATATVKVIHPAIALTKTPSASKIENNTSVTYTYNVTNTGDTPLTVGLTDDKFGTIFTGLSLSPGVSNITTVTKTLIADTTNTATATGVDQTGASATAIATATVKVINPGISLTKTPSAAKIENNTSVTYTYNVTNTGDTPLTVGLSDDKFGTIFTGLSLSPGLSNITTVTKTLIANTTNTATATGVDQTGASVTAIATATVKVINPAIMLTKTPSASKIENNTSVTYTYNVTNTGDTLLTVGLTDDKFGTIFTGLSLAPGVSNITTVTETLIADTTNTATATGVDQTGASVTATATATVNVINPAIALTKTPSASKVENNTSVTYTYNVTNTGNVALTVGLTDDKFGTIFTGLSLGPGVSNITTVTKTLIANTTNTATATGVDQTGASVTATATATVKVINPAISLTKTPSPNTPQLAPATFTYTYVVTNTGDTTLTGVTVYDETFNLQITLGTTTLAPGDSTSGTFSQTYTAAGTYTDVANATGVDQLGVKVFAKATATVVVTSPPKLPKQFTSSYGFGGFKAPEIIDNGQNTVVHGLKSGPRISWNVTYYFENTAAFLGAQYDGQAHYFQLWDKWGGNLMALNSTPVAFNPTTNIVTMANGKSFEINYAGYAGYVGNGILFTDSRGGNAWITLHTGDQQNGTNPGKGKGTTNDGSSYDADLVWNIGYVMPGASVSLTIVVAPGKNPGGQLEFTGTGFEKINTGPRVRVYSDAAFTDFLYAIDRTIQLGVYVYAN